MQRYRGMAQRGTFGKPVNTQGYCEAMVRDNKDETLGWIRKDIVRLLCSETSQNGSSRSA